MLRQIWQRWVLLFLCATLFGLFLASQSYLLYKSYNPKSIPVLPLVVLALVQTWTWFLLLRFILALTRRFPLERKMLFPSIAAHVPASVALSLVVIAARVAVTSHLPWYSSAEVQSFGSQFENLFFSSFHSNLLVYWGIIGTAQGLSYYRKLEERDLKASQLETRLAQAQLQVLKIQLQPHFLFNTLHAISVLVHKDADAADLMIARLSDLLRMTLQNAGAQEVTLQQELDFLEGYIEIERIRFQDRLVVSLNIAPEVRDARIPSFLLQPLVENAIKHGITTRSGTGHINVIATRSDAHLQLQIQDNGCGFPENAGRMLNEGLGLGNTRARLEQLYGTSSRMELINSREGGAVVTLSIPFSADPPDCGSQHA